MRSCCSACPAIGPLEGVAVGIAGVGTADFRLSHRSPVVKCGGVSCVVSARDSPGSVTA